MMKSFEVRQKFIDYFKRQGHTHVRSSSLIPENDPTLLFANAGMNQFKNTFLGLEKREYTRAVTSQKCVRAGGKHNDLENVGFTARHHTFFEMLGNFSFGDYFKKDAIHFAWEFLTKDLGIPKEKLYVSVFESDDEAAEIWNKQEGVRQDRIFRFGEKDNFWRMGDTGPCGPCSEIFYDHGPKAGKESDPYKGILAGEDRFVEIWNLVFMQFFEKSPGVMDPLPKPSVDTGSGLERVVAAMQGVLSNYDTDLFIPMIERGAELAKIKNYTNDQEVLSALRVLADHSRASAFLIGDGALPSNEGRGYVLRRIIRRALRYGRKISPTESILPSMVEVLIGSMNSIYPDLKERRNHIITTIRDEEERFFQTLDMGTEIFNEEIKKLKGSKTLSGEVVFKLYDTFGFPIDLTRLMAQEKGYSIDEAAFEKNMEEAREKAKASWKGKGLKADETHLIELAQKNKATHFTGYETLADKANIKSLSCDGKEVSTLNQGQAGIVIVGKTPFYAESGGQVGDTGTIKGTSGIAHVVGTTKANDVYFHLVEVQSGHLKLEDTVELTVTESDRRSTMANHSATHLLHSALRKVLGTHVTQAGSLVDSTKLRFDFTHNKSMSEKEKEDVENIVNEEIAKALDVNCTVKTYKEAVASGAMALFGEKYGDEVRVVKMGAFSTELCGGTHVKNTSQIRMFKLLFEAGVSAGVRRIEGLTGTPALKYFMKNTKENQRAREAAGFQESWVQYLESKQEPAEWIEKSKEQIRTLEKEIKKLKGGQINLDLYLNEAKAFKTKSGQNAKFVQANVDIDDRQVLTEMVDKLRDRVGTGVVLIVGKAESGGHPLIVSVTKDINTDVHAGNLLKEVAGVLGGKGGGRPDFAQGSAPDKSNFSQAVVAAYKMLGVS